MAPTVDEYYENMRRDLVFRVLKAPTFLWTTKQERSFIWNMEKRQVRVLMQCRAGTTGMVSNH